MKPRARILTPDTDIRAFLISLTPEERALALTQLGEAQLEAIDRSWPFWQHEGQGEPPGDWRTWVIQAGRGFGKTRAGAEWIFKQVKDEKPIQIALVAATLAEARKVMVEGRSGLLSVADHWIDDWLPSRCLLRFSNGSEARLYSGASPDSLRGPEHHVAWCDELAKWEKPQDSWDMLQLGMRLGTRPRVLITTTPRSVAILSKIVASRHTVVTRGSSHANPHLPAAFLEAIDEQYAGTRLGRQEINGELLPDVAGALWSVDLLESCRVMGVSRSRGHPIGCPPQLGQGDTEYDVPPRFTRTVIGVDPPSGDGTCGIIACAIDESRIAYVLADHSVTARSPEGWAMAVAAAAEAHGTKEVIAENNQGGAMVRAVLHAADPSLRVKPAHAALNKSDRATPIAMRFESGKVRLNGTFPDLEAQLCGLIMGGGYEGPGSSPDRADAMVWALTELMLGKERAEPRVRVL